MKFDLVDEYKNVGFDGEESVFVEEHREVGLEDLKCENDPIIAILLEDPPVEVQTIAVTNSVEGVVQEAFVDQLNQHVGMLRNKPLPKKAPRDHSRYTAMELQLFSLPYFFFVSQLSLYLYFYIYSAYKKSKKPGFKLYPLVGALPGFIKNRHRFLEWTTEAVKDCPTHSAVFHRPGKLYGVFTANPSNIEYILKTNFENYPKGERMISLLEDFLGQGIFNSNGELWKVQRKTASYEFNTKSLRNFVIENVSSEISARLLPTLTNAVKSKQVLDLQYVLERFTFDNICKVAFNVDPGCLDGGGF
ncbi:hypothetical protein LWI28_014199 [Acer negundo]|uniref:Cytochrome P450 n=1 Tax=Acer negundo TaxID=4023 RepID=A0AAD5IDX5_ACENE|nr:hypothetical protein LWI28_014199 [Acer negundo]